MFYTLLYHRGIICWHSCLNSISGSPTLPLDFSRLRLKENDGTYPKIVLEECTGYGEEESKEEHTGYSKEESKKKKDWIGSMKKDHGTLGMPRDNWRTTINGLSMHV